MSDKPRITTLDELDIAMTAIAQGVINIHEGLTTIEAGSRVHRAMAGILEAYTSGQLRTIMRARKDAK